MRRVRRLDGVSETYADTTGGSTTPVRPYRPAPPVVYVPPPTQPPSGPLGPGPIQFVQQAAVPAVTITRTPPSPVDEALTAELRIKAVRAIQLQAEPSSPYAVQRVQRPPLSPKWDEYEARVAALPWRGSQPRHGANPVDVIRTLKRRAAAGSPDAEEAAKGFVWRMENAEAQAKAAGARSWSEHVSKIKALPPAKPLPSYAEKLAKMQLRPATTPREKLAALEAVEPWFAKGLVQHLIQQKADEYKVSPAQAVEIAYALASKDVMWIAREASGVRDISGRTSADLRAGGGEIGSVVKSGLDKLAEWAGFAKTAAPKVVERATSWEQSAKELIAPVAGQYIGKAAVLGFAATFDKFINNPVPSDPAKARSWANSVYSSMIAFAMKPQKVKDDTSRAISAEVTGRWETRIRQDIAEAASTQGEATQDHVFAAKRVQEDLRLMRKDIENVTARVVAASIQKPASVPAKHKERKLDAAPSAPTLEQVLTAPERFMGTQAPQLSKRDEQILRAQMSREGQLPDEIDRYVASLKGGRK